MAMANPVTEEEISCPVCFETFDNKDREPKRLTCPHSICVACVRRLPSPRCPVCKLEITLPIKELAKDLSILRLLQSHTCSECDKLGELRTCKRCKVPLCEICEKKHRTPKHCKIFMNIKTMEKKLNTEAVRKIRTQNVAASEGVSENRITEMFKRIREEVETALNAQQRMLCAAVRSASEVTDDARKIRAAQELMTQATLLLESPQTRKQELDAMVKETENVVRLMDNPPVVFQAENLVETLNSDFEKLMSDIKKFGESIKIPIEFVPDSDIQNPTALDVVQLPNHGAKRQVKRTISGASAGEKLRNIWTLAECPQSGRIFVGGRRSCDPLWGSQIHVYEDWKWLNSIKINLLPVLLLVHEGRLHVVGHGGLRGSYSISAFDSRTGNQVYEQALDTTILGDCPKFFASQLGGNLYCFSHHDQTISELSLKGQVKRRIKLANSPVNFSKFAPMAVSSRREFLILERDDSTVYVFSNTGEYKHTINLNLPPRCRPWLFTTDYQDNLLIRVRTDDASGKYTILVYDKDHGHVASIDLSGLGICYPYKMMVTKTGDLVVAEADNMFSLADKLYILEAPLQ